MAHSFMKHTKVVATLGPASDSRQKIQDLYDAGMDVARLNFSHGTHEYFEKLISRIRDVNCNIAIMLDTKGPEIRTGKIENGSVSLKKGDDVILTNKECLSTRLKLCIKYQHLASVEIGSMVLLDDGLIELSVVDNRDSMLVARVQNSGELGSNKTVTIKGHDVDVPFLTKKDREDIMFAINENLSFIAASFVRSRRDIHELRTFIDKYNSKIKIIAKIEHPAAVENLDEIIASSDGVMVARGDLGVEVSAEKVPKIQADIIQACNTIGKPVIVATQMLESMKENPRPTRAEVSDVAQAILQGTDAIMLSGETAIGAYPVESVETFTRIAQEYDLHVQNNICNDIKKESDRRDIVLFITRGAHIASRKLGASAILAPTETGYTARKVSRFKPRCPILAITPDKTVLRQLQLVWGVLPMLETRQYKHSDEMVRDLVHKSLLEGVIKKDDRVVVIAGHKVSERGTTNMLEIFYVSDLVKG